ncbi:Protein of unknown function [Pyronema omphalodes CBS 100304]|uniref:Uncharacterized protein n=1 Tax=Pyronema omphalodes (strain CBS 100304) TaxID=1076935 RepID=U4LCC6_PYROM|nr:Protein of unknown function [Pyronema omphalodes CBS 100304]
MDWSFHNRDAVDSNKTSLDRIVPPVNPSSKQPGTSSPSKTSRAWIRGTLGIWAPSHLALQLKKPPIGAAKKLTPCDDLRRTRRHQRHRKVEVKSGSGRRRPEGPKLGSCRLTNLRTTFNPPHHHHTPPFPPRRIYQPPTNGRKSKVQFLLATTITVIAATAISRLIIGGQQQPQIHS